MQEIRIYYESYEQANHFIKPIIEAQFPKIETKLIYLSKGKKYREETLIARILKFKNPDILISFVQDEKEIPLFVIEFSEAVTTEDHELQRFDGYLAAVAGNCFYVKISPFKESQSQHGGNTNFNTLEPYALVYKRFKFISFHFEWPLETPNYVKRNPIYYSCPPQIQEFNYLINATIDVVSNNFINCIKKGFINFALLKIESNNIIKKWINNLRKYKLDDIYPTLNSTRIQWLADKKCILFKYNRMGHAMDPERGMIWYHRYRHNKPIISRIVFPSTGDKFFNDNKLNSNFDYLKAFISGTSLDKNKAFNKFCKYKGYIVGESLKKCDLDITEFLENNINYLNKQLLSIFSNSKEFLIQDKQENTKIRLFWRKNFSLFKNKLKYNSIKITKRDYITEDDVTYIIAQVLGKNGFKILSLSYPGAQGDRAILPQAGTGRKQTRNYIDIVSYYPKKFIDLNENKGAYKLAEVKSDISKLHCYKNDKSFVEALSCLMKKISPDNANLPLLLSVGFWVSSENKKLNNLPINKLNFFITISPNMKNWKIWVGGDLDIFQFKEGLVCQTTTYSVL